MSIDIEPVRDEVRDACRVLALLGVLNDVAGHVSARARGDSLLMRCRTEDERGLLFTSDPQVAQLNFKDGVLGDSDGPVIPIEASIHTAIYRARPDVGAVVHAHPPASLLCGLTHADVLPLRAYDYLPIRTVLEGIAVYESAAMIDRPERADALVQALGDRHVCLLRGHGIVATGATVREATLRAIAYENAARMTWQLVSSGLPVDGLNEDEVRDADHTSGAGQTAKAIQGSWADWNWQYLLALLAERDAGRTIPLEKGWP